MPLYKFLASRRFSRYIKITQLSVDVLLLNFMYLLSIFLRFGEWRKIHDQEVQTIWLLSNVTWILLAVYLDIHKLVRVHRIEQFLSKTLKALAIHIGIIAFVIVVLKYEQISRLRIFYFYSGFAFYLLLVRYSTLKMLKYLRKEGFNFRRVIIIGDNNNSSKIAMNLQSDLAYGYQVMGIFSDNINGNELTAKHLGNLDQVEDYLNDNHIHEMYVALHYDQSNRISQYIHLAESKLIRIKFLPDFSSYTKSRHVNIDFYGNIPVLMLRPEPLESAWNRLVKKLFDFTFSILVILLIFSWLFPILMLMIKMSSKGPVFFRQKRSGEDNKEFTCLKFRTMRVNTLADELQASKNDPRITKLGSFMRKTNLDELPQFFNVLWGNMSVVGPRPHMVKHTEEYSALINEYLVRHFAKPGITGWAQVNGFRGETKELKDMQKRIEFDIWYIENWSFLLDLKIIWLTVWNMLKGEKNAY